MSKSELMKDVKFGRVGKKELQLIITVVVVVVREVEKLVEKK